MAITMPRQWVTRYWPVTNGISHHWLSTIREFHWHQYVGIRFTLSCLMYFYLFFTDTPKHLGGVSNDPEPELLLLQNLSLTLINDFVATASSPGWNAPPPVTSFFCLLVLEKQITLYSYTIPAATEAHWQLILHPSFQIPETVLFSSGAGLMNYARQHQNEN